MGITKSLLISLVATSVKAMLSAASPFVRAALEAFLKDLYQKAKESPNPMDDMLVEFIASLLGIDVEADK